MRAGSEKGQMKAMYAIIVGRGSPEARRRGARAISVRWRALLLHVGLLHSPTHLHGTQVNTNLVWGSVARRYPNLKQWEGKSTQVCNPTNGVRRVGWAEVHALNNLDYIIYRFNMPDRALVLCSAAAGWMMISSARQVYVLRHQM